MLRQQGYAVLSPAGVAAWSGCPLPELQRLFDSWNSLPPDNYLKDGGHYRRRRHSCYVAGEGRVDPVPHRAHWQPVEYNALHGGMQRWFEPVEPAVAESAGWQCLLRGLAATASELRGPRPWSIEAHQFRIDTEGGIGRPTPEGAHRDGVDLVAVFLVGRENIKGGETRVFQADGPNGQRFTLTEPWSLLLLDDERVIHETTPIQPAGGAGHRDTLVLTCRAGGFQGD
nr:2OG-Fe dioxygenase family protein [Ramlibacter agri]